MSRRHFLSVAGGFGLGAASLALLAGCGSDSGEESFVPNPTPSASPSPGAEPFSGTVRRSEPQMRAVVERFLALNVPPLPTLSPVEARTQPAIQDAARLLLQQQGRDGEREPVGSVQDRLIPGPAGPMMARVYTPAGSGPFPVTVYFHGGGWVIGTIETYDSSARALCNAANTVLVSVEYRKGPENRFPAAHEDAYAATQYVMSNVGQFNGIEGRVAVAGESAGGNLASAVCILARERGGRMPVHQLLVYPIADNDTSRPSYNENAEAVPLNRALMQYFFANYLRSPADGEDRLISLVQADVSGLPPATVITAEIDPLRSEGQEYAQRLASAGIPVRYRNFEGVTHEFFGLGQLVAQAREAVAFAAEGLRSGFGG